MDNHNISGTGSQNVTAVKYHDYRDATYHFDDGDILLLVETTLFKIHSSFVGRECEMFRPGSSLLGNSQTINLFDINAEQFRNFLLMFYGLPSDENYRLLVSDPVHASQRDIPNFRVYLDVAELADRFVAPRLRAWAQTQLKRVLRLPGGFLSRYNLNWEYQIRVILLAKRTGDAEFLAAARSLVQLHFIWVSKDSPVQFSVEHTLMVDVIKERAVKLYKYPTLRDDDTALFGFLFCYVLSLGPDFAAKTALLTRSDRVALLSAQVLLTPLPTSSLDLDWLCTLSSGNRRGDIATFESCPTCDFYPAWEAVFGGGYYQQLRENATPLFGISQLVPLPFKRLQLSDLIAEMDLVDCQQSCSGRLLDYVDSCVQNVFVRLSSYCKDVE